MFQQESAIILFQCNDSLHTTDIIGASIGRYTDVDFRFERVWIHKKTNELGIYDFIHVHPPEFGCLMSEKDKSVIRGFQISFLKPDDYLLFTIVCFIDDSLENTASAGMVYKVTASECIVWDKWKYNKHGFEKYLFMLKAMSYAERGDTTEYDKLTSGKLE